MKKPFDLNAPYQPAHFEFKSLEAVDKIVTRYPGGRQQSAVMPLLDLAQRQVAEEGAKAKPPYGGWIPRAAMDHIAEIIGVPPVKVYEVTSFYSMYNMAPVGVNLVQVCTTTPCWLCGSDKIVQACEKELGIHMNETTADGKFTLVEVECLGACVNAPMMQINDDFYEDLDEAGTKELLQSLASGKKPAAGSIKNRKASMALSGPTTLAAQARKAGI
ncbi:MAG: NADH-quinone oxidoreductase subunit NuoE [Alphaproteobacteria bacterium]